MVLNDLTGKRFGRLTVLRRDDEESLRRVFWICQCDCGRIVSVSSCHLNSGHTKSCGCLHKEQLSQRMKTHGMSDNRLHTIWADMRLRCNNPKARGYDNYGGRGINICEEWDRADGFPLFYEWSMANGYDENLTLDRIDNNKGYSPGNCRWADRKTQANNSRKNHLIDYCGQRKSIAQFSEEHGQDPKLVWGRIFSLGWSIEDALTLPVGARGHYRRKDESD